MLRDRKTSIELQFIKLFSYRDNKRVDKGKIKRWQRIIYLKKIRIREGRHNAGKKKKRRET